MLPDRKTAARLGRETLAALELGSYEAPSGRAVDLRAAVTRSVAQTRSYAPAAPLPACPPPRFVTGFEVCSESTLAATRKLAEAGLEPAALNFASAKNPGGGFLSGARAQEESLARSSGLYACLQGQPMYAHHRELRSPLYSSWVIYSPAVPVFRADAGALLEEPWSCAFVTSPAVNAGVALQRDPGCGPAIREAMTERVERVLRVAAAHGHETLVLGAWGCGVFANDPALIAELFQSALEGPFRGAFARVVFAILDFSPEQRTLRPFVERFG